MLDDWRYQAYEHARRAARQRAVAARRRSHFWLYMTPVFALAAIMLICMASVLLIP